MKKVIALLSIVTSGAVFAQANPEVFNTPLGSGNASFGKQKATQVYRGLYHVPMYMPGYPTASVLWPTIVKVECEENLKNCESFDYKPSYGRGEYIFFKPVPGQSKQTTTTTVPDNVSPKPVVIFKEVPVKPNRE